MSESPKSKAELFGEYLLSLTPSEKAFSGVRVKVISQFIESGEPLSKEGYKQYLKTNGFNVSDAERKYLTDYLFFAGVRRIGGPRKEKGKVVQKLEVISEANKKKISAFLEWMKAQRDYSPNSIRMRRDHMVKFFKYFNEFNLANCRDFLATQEHEGKAPTTLNLYMVSLMQYGKWQKTPIPLKKISIPRSLFVENVPTEKEYQSFVEWLRTHEEWQIYWMVRVLGSTGMRKSELRQLKWVDILSGEFYPKCKGKKRRMIYFPKSLVKELKEWLKAHPTDMSREVLSSSRYDSPFADRTIDFILKHRAKKAGFPLEKAHCHAFRHFFAKQFLAKTKDVIQLAELLGHESVDTTRLYLQKSKVEQARDINKYITW